ncbi:zinc metalloproteinase nas-14-like [Dendronephthya gigantea]|uniref:zinc metalloproteinase nas-14-like n=1 Tax=Dendronephthya gigantea TaxID=151771 RepID=UPI00106CC5D8|nr:zinc metalloproteinase nas-14-like [Dendronephthya gigantea]
MAKIIFVVLLFLVFSPLSIGGPLPDASSNSNSNTFEDDGGTDVMTEIAIVNEENDLDLFESDIVLHKEENTVTKRNARRSRKFLWQNKKVPYEITQELIDSWYGPTILKAIDEFHRHTCVQFVSHTNEKNWIQFVKEKGCWSSVGQNYWMSGPQKLSLGAGCNMTATVMHELLHALGFWHEQSRADRNNYVEIFWENIREGKEHNFMKENYFTVDHQDKPYDFQSLMHYGNSYFSKNGMDTIRSIVQTDLKLGQRNGFSQLDIDEVNDLYDCNSTNVGWSSWSTFTPCDAGCKKKRERFCTSSNPSKDCPGTISHGVEEEIVVCSVVECNAPIAGHWGRWSSWSSCSTRCGPGTRSRARTCDDPVPRNGGKNCVGDGKEENPCVFQSCGLGPDDCEFEVDANGFCGWTQDVSDNLDWKRSQGPTPSSQTGPVADHTSGGGHYLFIESSSPARTGHKARLISKTFSGSNQSICFILSYNMYGSGMGSLNIYLSNAEGKKLVFSKVGDQGKQWQTVHLDLSSTSDYHVIIEGVRGMNFRSDIAIDDITFIHDSCSDTPMRNLGCYRDDTRPLDDHFKNIRSNIDWFDMSKTIVDCAKAAKENGYKVFGVEFYGECWSSDKAKDIYNRDGRSNECWHGVGKEWAFQAYELL